MIAALLARRDVSLALKLAPWLAIALLAAALFATRSTLTRTRADHRAVLAEQQRDAAEAKALNALRVAKAADTYASRTAALQPLIVRSTDTVRTYAETPAGRARCLDADRVRGLDALDSSLRAAEPAGGGADALQPDASAPPAGR